MYKYKHMYMYMSRGMNPTMAPQPYGKRDDTENLGPFFFFSFLQLKLEQVNTLDTDVNSEYRTAVLGDLVGYLTFFFGGSGDE